MTKIESGMTFTFDNAFTYIMEDDKFYKKLSSKYGTKDVDFIIKRDDKLLFIEAKTSSPKELNEYISDIAMKFTDSIWIFVAILLERTNTQSICIPSQMKDLAHIKSKIQLFLIIKNAEKRHLGNIKNALTKKLRKEIQMFSLEPNVIVMNESQAENKKFINVIHT
jgi:Holliday junction resolvase